MLTLNLRRIQTFVAIAELGSFRAAGEKLHRSPSAVSAHVSQLEQELGVPLLNRTTRRVSLTDAGQTLLTRCKSLFADLDSAVRELREESEVRRGRVSIGSSPAMLGSLLPPILSVFRARYPGVLLRLKEDFARNVYETLAKGETDFAIGPRIEGLGDLEFRSLVTNPYMVVVPAASPLAAGDSVTLAQAMAHPQVVLPPETGSRQTIEILFAQRGAAFSTQYDVKQLQTMFAMVEAGLGVAITPLLSVPPARNRRYRILRLREPTVEQEICLVTSRGKRLSPPAVKCGELIAARLRKFGQPSGGLSATL